MSLAAYKVTRTEWPSGPWDDETEDRIEWRHSSGLPCLMVRNLLGNWCGYVGVHQAHPAFEKDYEGLEISVHGGLTYANHCQGAICHVPQNGESDNVWWLGFDCAHLGDVCPGSLRFGRDYNSTYKDAAYVRNETNQLADQLATMEKSA